MRVIKMPYLQLVDGIYRVRIVVPDDLRPHLLPPHTGKANLTKALGTGNKAEANRLAIPWIAEFQAAMTTAAEIKRNPNRVVSWTLPPIGTIGSFAMPIITLAKIHSLQSTGSSLRTRRSCYRESTPSRSPSTR